MKMYGISHEKLICAGVSMPGKTALQTMPPAHLLISKQMEELDV